MENQTVFITLAAIGIAAILIVISNIKIVPQAYAYIIERFGGYYATWSVGLHFKVPFIDRISKRVNLKEQVVDFPPQPVITKDNVSMQIDTVIYFQITDPKLYTYGVERPMMAIENLTATTLRNIIGDLDLDGTLTSRDTVNTKMRAILDEATDPWGIKINRVELKNIIPPKEIQNAMEKQMKAERDRRETMLQAEGHKAAAITRAEGDKQAMILAAEGERDARIARAEGEAKAIYLSKKAEADGLAALKEAGVDAVVLELKKYEALVAMSDGKAAKIIVPTDAVEMVKSNVVFSETTGLGDKTDPDNTQKIVEKKADPCCE